MTPYKPKVFDTFIFYNELELLDIRFNIMNPYVDHFVIVESKKTFTGNAKPLYYQENKHRFERFNHKVIHVVTDFVSTYGWANEASQRNEIRQGLVTAQPDDIVILSDLDEIPNLGGFDFDNVGDDVWGCKQRYYYYKLNISMSLDQYITKIFKMKHLDNMSPQEARGSHTKEWDNTGWHFSFLGDEDFIINKIQNFSHQDFNLPEYTNKEALRKRIEENKDLFDRSYGFETVPIDERFPVYIQDNQESLKHLIRPL